MKLGRLSTDPTLLLVVSACVGAASGLISVGFWKAIHLLDTLRISLVGEHRLLLSATPAAGALLMVIFTFKLAKTPARLGVAGVMYDSSTNPGSIPMRYLPATFVAAALVIGSGGSAGREAPVVVMGSLLGAWTGKWLRLSRRRRQVLAASGTAAAIAAAFDAPLAGVFFAVELLLEDYAVAALSPVVLASVAGTVVCRALEGEGASHFSVPPYHLEGWWEIGLYALLGLAAGVVGPMFAALTKWVHKVFSSLKKVPAQAKPVLGAAGVGIVAYFLPQVMGNGYEHVQHALSGGLAAWLMLALVPAKSLATALTLGSGGWGGDFAPILFVGAMLGGSLGKFAEALLPSAGLAASAYAMVGMGATLAAAVRCPVTSILLLFELTGTYHVVLPVMTASSVATVVARLISRHGMYHAELEEMGGPTATAREARLLSSIKVAEVMRPRAVTLWAGSPYKEILRVIATSDQLLFPVLDTDGRLLGALTFKDLRAFLNASELEDVVVAADVASEDVPVLSVRDSLEEAMRLFASFDLEELPVVEDHHSRKFAGIITRRQALAARARALAEWEMEE